MCLLKKEANSHQVNAVVKCRIWYLYSCIDCPDGIKQQSYIWSRDDGNYYCKGFMNKTGKLRRIPPIRGKITIPNWCPLPK